MNVAVFPTKRIGKVVLDYITKNHPDHLKLIVFENDTSDLYNEYKSFSPHIIYSDINNQLDMINTLDLDWIFLAWWPHIIKKNIIDIPKNGVINTHNSLLPFNRGVHPNFWAMVEKKEYGVTIHKVTPGVDDGDIIAQTRIAYNWEDTGDDLYERGMLALSRLFEETYPKIVSGNYESFEQDHSVMTCHKTSEIENICNLNLDKEYKAEELFNIIRAKDCLGKQGAYFLSDGRKYEVRLKIKRISNEED